MHTGSLMISVEPAAALDMGGPGSGRHWHLGAKRSTADELRLDVRALHRAGLLTPGATGMNTWRSFARVSNVGVYVEGDDDRAEAFRLAYVAGGEPIVLRVPLEWTPCHYGGLRPWAVCPACRRRVAVLYGGRRFACRQCRGLAYVSTRRDRATRLITKAQRIRERLGGSANLGEPFPPKPPRMHWRTYHRLRDAADEAHLEGLTDALARIRGAGDRTKERT